MVSSGIATLKSIQTRTAKSPGAHFLVHGNVFRQKIAKVEKGTDLNVISLHDPAVVLKIFFAIDVNPVKMFSYFIRWICTARAAAHFA